MTGTLSASAAARTDRATALEPFLFDACADLHRLRAELVYCALNSAAAACGDWSGTMADAT